MFVFYKDAADKWVSKIWQITTDPGTKSLKIPQNSKGTAILVPGQYVNAYRIGLHQGKYEAVVQKGPVKVYRDNNRDNILNMSSDKIYTGIFGINIHKAGLDSKVVEGWSAGCTVFKRSEDFNQFLLLAKKHVKLYGNSLTLTLINE